MAEQTDRSPRPPLTRNWFTFVGAAVAIAGFFAAALLLAMDFFHGFKSPYVGILTYIVSPGFLFIGLGLFIAGVLVERRRRRAAAPDEVAPYPRIDFNVPHQRHIFAGVALIGVVLTLFTAVGSYRTYQFTESVPFCGRTCHSVMKPEYTAYQESPHARVACVQCHIGPGATWFVKSKLSGAYQVYATIADNYPRPIPVPISNLRPAQETCEQCHWPRKFYGRVEKVNHHYLPDEKNTPWTVHLLVKIGGGDPTFGPVGGIHWHMNIANKVEYIARDRQRQDIPWVKITDRNGHSTIYQSQSKPLTKAQIAKATPRVMDCIDCHNRPTHIYHSPVDSVNLAISTDRIDPAIPEIKLQAVDALLKKYSTTKAATAGIAKTLQAFYSKKYPDYVKSHGGVLKHAISEVQIIYRHNFFPQMKVNWQSYPNNIGHKDSLGCFRCHDGDHVSKDGKTITRKCDTCHTIISEGSGPAAATISPEGMEFKHPVDIGEAWKDMLCTDCHNGSIAQD